MTHEYEWKGRLYPVYPDAIPAGGGLFLGKKIRPELLNSGRLSLEKFSAFIRKKYVPRICTITSNRLRVAICGDADAGKDQVAQCVKSLMTIFVKVSSVSENALQRLLCDGLHDCLDPTWGQAVFEARDLCRMFWFHAGESLTEIDPTFLIRHLMRDHGNSEPHISAQIAMINGATDRIPQLHLVTGIRRVVELEAAYAEDLIDCSICVIRSGVPADATNEIKPTKTDLIFDNSGSVGDLRVRVSRLVHALTGRSK